MLPEIGNLALAFALALALIQFVVPLTGIAMNHWRMVLIARPAAIAQFVFVSISLLISFL